jgi:hypothetical protein
MIVLHQAVPIVNAVANSASSVLGLVRRRDDVSDGEADRKIDVEVFPFGNDRETFLYPGPADMELLRCRIFSPSAACVSPAGHVSVRVLGAEWGNDDLQIGKARGDLPFSVPIRGQDVGFVLYHRHF